MTYGCYSMGVIGKETPELKTQGFPCRFFMMKIQGHSFCKFLHRMADTSNNCMWEIALPPSRSEPLAGAATIR